MRLIVLGALALAMMLTGCAAPQGAQADPVKQPLDAKPATPPEIVVSSPAPDDREITVELPADVLFDFGKFRLRTEAQASIEKAIEVLRGHTQALITINGHTDSIGGDAYNDALSLRRAQAVAQALAARLAEGGQQRTLTVNGFGRRNPIVPNTKPDGSDDPQGRQRNRRVEILIQPQHAVVTIK